MIDKELYRKAYEGYREWNEVELQERIRNPGRLSPEEAWAQYKALWAFAVKLVGPMSLEQRRYRLAKKAETIEKPNTTDVDYNYDAHLCVVNGVFLNGELPIKLTKHTKPNRGYKILNEKHENN